MAHDVARTVTWVRERPTGPAQSTRELCTEYLTAPSCPCKPMMKSGLSVYGGVSGSITLQSVPVLRKRRRVEEP